jgi:gas vesicle protein
VNHKTKAVFIGIGAGALLGAAFAWVASDGSNKEEKGDALSAVKQLGPMDYFALGIAILTLARQFGGMLKKA